VNALNIATVLLIIIEVTQLRSPANRVSPKSSENNLVDRMEYLMEDSLQIKQEQRGPFPMGRVRHVEKPTTLLTDNIQRIDMRNTAYGLAERGEYGPVVQKGVQKSLPGKYPLSAAQKDVIDYIALMESNPVAVDKAPIPQEPEILTHHIKSVGYFLKADIMGTCKVPESAYYSHDKQGTGSTNMKMPSSSSCGKT
jgi:hypothetical protein